MKSIWKLFALLIILSFTLSSCGKDDCTESSCTAGYECVDGECAYIVPTCDACGLYDGLATGLLTLNFGWQDTTQNNIPITINSTEGNIAYAYMREIDISAFLGSPANTLVIEVASNLSDRRIRFVNETYNYQGLATVIVDGEIDFNESFDIMEGEIKFSQDLRGTITFQALRQ